MSLVRSEHANDQGVQQAKDTATAAEKALEEARTRLEKRERAQYHEEQIWSDTIRRNSTWVTIGLMGVNIGLLLVNLVIFEPWRRRRLVREVRTALDEKDFSSAAVPVIAETIDIKADQSTQQESLPSQPAEGDAEPVPSPAILVEISEPNQPDQTIEVFQTWSIGWLKSYITNLFSNQSIIIRKVDITTVAIQAATASATITGLAVFLMLRVR
jgi:sensitive to high expression protein 9